MIFQFDQPLDRYRRPQSFDEEVTEAIVSIGKLCSYLNNSVLYGQAIEEGHTALRDIAQSIDSLSRSVDHLHD